MSMSVGKELALLTRMTVNELRGKFAEVCGEQTNARHKGWLVRRIAWRIQALAEGDISDRARQRAAELANDADLRTSAPKAAKISAAAANCTTAGTLRIVGDDRLPMPGTILTRKYKGQALQVHVLANGFEFEGETYKSLSAVAKAITDSHCNGYLFFRLNGHGGAK